jgi:hypothetical protein
MGVPLPRGTLAQIQHPWPGEEDYAQVSDAERMKRQDDAYHGRFVKPLRPTNEQEPDQNVIDNRCDPIVSTYVNSLLGDKVGFDVSDPETDKADEEAQQYLDDVWDANVKHPTMAEFEINAATFGHGFYKLIPDDPDMSLDADGLPFPSLSILNPMQMKVRTLPNDVRKVTRYAFTYFDWDQNGATIACRQLTERLPNGLWNIRDQVHQGALDTNTIAGILATMDAAALREEDYGWKDTFVTPWPFTWSPIHDCKNLPEPNSYLGKADLTLDVIHLNDVLNFLLSNRQRILYYQGHPWNFLFGVSGHGDIEITPAGLVCIPNTDARVDHVEMTGNLAAIEAAIKDIREDMDELSHVPAVAIGRQEHLQPASGVALKVAYRPMVLQVVQKQALRQSLYGRLNTHMLELKRPEWANRKVACNWPVLVPSDDLLAAQAAQVWSGMGVSNDTLMQRADPPFNPDTEREKKDKEQQLAMKQATAMMLATTPPTPPGGGPGNGGSDGQPGGQSQEGPGSAGPPPSSNKPKKPPKSAA